MPPEELGISHWSSARMAAYIRRTEGVSVSQPWVSRLWRGEAADAAVPGEDAGLGLDFLGGEDALDRGEQRVAVEQFQVAGELLDSVGVHQGSASCYN
jgi:hypothetical protein